MSTVLFDAYAGLHGIEIHEFSGLNETRLEQHRRYARQHFNDEFRYGQGTEEVLATLSKFGRGGDWMDLGAGPTTLFWSIPLSGVTSVTCCDLTSEALKVLDEFVEGDELPRCYRQVLDMFGKQPAHVEEMKRCINHYYVFDALKAWPEELAGRSYDLITGLGLFGLAPTPGQYLECFGHASQHLRKGGRIIGANWIRSAALVRAEGHDNSYLSEALVAEGAQQAGMELLQLKRCEIRDDRSYDAVIVWAMEGTPNA